MPVPLDSSAHPKHRHPFSNSPMADTTHNRVDSLTGFFTDEVRLSRLPSQRHGHCTYGSRTTRFIKLWRYFFIARVDIFQIPYSKSFGIKSIYSDAYFFFVNNLANQFTRTRSKAKPHHGVAGGNN
jgi:hypothetical protein